MGFFESIGGFLGGDTIGDEISAQQGYAMGPWNKSWQDLFGKGGMQEKTIRDYRKQFGNLIKYFDKGAKQVESEMRVRQAEEMEYLGVGKEASLQRVGQRFEEVAGQTQAQNIMQGLSSTSWGQQSLGAVTAEQGLAEAGVETGYAQAFAETTNRQAMQMATMGQWRIGGGAELRGQYASGLAGLRGSWANRKMGM